jgi:hypothetical protein
MLGLLHGIAFKSGILASAILLSASFVSLATLSFLLEADPF